MFVDTNVDVYMYTSTQINAYTLPGSYLTAKPLLLKLQEALTGGPIRILLTPILMILGPIINLGLMISTLIGFTLIVIDQIANIGINAFKNGNPWKFSYDKSTNKVKLNISNITIYVTSNLLKLMDNDNEVKAVLLHEVGHNLNHTYSIINRLLGLGVLSSFTIYMYRSIVLKEKPFIEKYIEGKGEEGLKEKLALFCLVLLMQIVIFLMQIILNFPRRFDETYADEMAIKMGYGRELESALLKMMRYYTPEENLGSRATFLEKVTLYFSKIMNSIAGGYPTDRLKKVKEKTDQYGTDITKITDDHIDYTPTNNVY